MLYHPDDWETLYHTPTELLEKLYEFNGAEMYVWMGFMLGNAAGNMLSCNGLKI